MCSVAGQSKCTNADWAIMSKSTMKSLMDVLAALHVPVDVRVHSDDCSTVAITVNYHTVNLSKPCMQKIQ